MSIYGSIIDLFNLFVGDLDIYLFIYLFIYSIFNDTGGSVDTWVLVIHYSYYFRPSVTDRPPLTTVWVTWIFMYCLFQDSISSKNIASVPG